GFVSGKPPTGIRTFTGRPPSSVSAMLCVGKAAGVTGPLVSSPGSGDGFGRAGDEPSASIPPLAVPNPSTPRASFCSPGMTTTDEWSLVEADVITKVLPLGLVAVAIAPSVVVSVFTMSVLADGLGKVTVIGEPPSTETRIVLWLALIVKEAGALFWLEPWPNTAPGSRLSVTMFGTPLIIASTHFGSVAFIARPPYCSTVVLPLASGILVSVTVKRFGSALGQSITTARPLPAKPPLTAVKSSAGLPKLSWMASVAVVAPGATRITQLSCPPLRKYCITA